MDSKPIRLSKVSEDQLTKLYYTIGEVAKMFDVNTSLIRFWEKEFPTIKPKKNKKGNRLFTPKDVVKIDRIYELVKVNGYTLEGAKKAMKNGSAVENEEASVNSQNDEIISRLESIKSKLISLKSN